MNKTKVFYEVCKPPNQMEITVSRTTNRFCESNSFNEGIIVKLL